MPTVKEHEKIRKERILQKGFFSILLLFRCQQREKGKSSWHTSDQARRWRMGSRDPPSICLGHFQFFLSAGTRENLDNPATATFQKKKFPSSFWADFLMPWPTIVCPALIRWNLCLVVDLTTFPISFVISQSVKVAHSTSAWRLSIKTSSLKPNWPLYRRCRPTSIEYI